jgi:hypothetical protein
MMALRHLHKRLPVCNALWQESLCAWSGAVSSRHFAAPQTSEEASLKKTALYDFHVQHGGNIPIIFYDICSKTCTHSVTAGHPLCNLNDCARASPMLHCSASVRKTINFAS